MCFKKSPSIPVVEPQVVERKQADASLTKNSQIEKNNKSAFAENLRTSAYGLTDYAQTEKNTLLGE